MTRAMLLPFFLALPSAAAASDSLLQFTIDGETVSGHTVTLAPVEGAPVSSVVDATLQYTGAASALLPVAYAESSDGDETEGISAFDWSAGRGTAASTSDAGLALRSDECTLSVSVAAPADTIYLGIGGGIGDSDGDGVCDDLDAAARDTEPVYGQTVYYAARSTRGGLLDFETTISGAAGKRLISADLGTEYCHVGVWDDDGLVHKDTVPCAAIGSFLDRGGDAYKEVPKDQHISVVWSDVVGDYVTKVVWTWGGGAIDISYHYPGLAWVE